ncbi:hypothetical protein C5167_020876 [Papaver somniferum]|uniref:Uncharacterized protein n=1 Tax=Papaver somniferum TaxID=3469 RepID=A0A4Y7IY79_PAPSO|nr:hypothetical protein C5167_020876 [Papaver somniferum]
MFHARTNTRKHMVTLWGESTSELTRNLEEHGLNPLPVVAVVAGLYVKQYLGKASLSSANATKITLTSILQRSCILEKGLPAEHLHLKSHSQRELITIRQPNPLLTLKTLDVVAKGEVEGLATVHAAFESLIVVFQDYLILITPYNMKYLEIPSFTVAKFPSPPLAPTPTISARDTPKSFVLKMSM